ncbi:MAG: hypothetical protein ACHQKY_09305 [Terriglobia bacterium]
MRYTPFILLMLTFVVQAAPAGDKAASPDFSGYPQTESFRSYLRSQTDVAWHLQRTDLLAISVFPRGDRFALQYFVTESGQETDYRNVYDWAIQAGHQKQLSEGELKILRSVIHDLPTESVSPPIERLVIVSFHEGASWVTRTYDSNALPKPVRQIYDIIGERCESRKER